MRKARIVAARGIAAAAASLVLYQPEMALAQTAPAPRREAPPAAAPPAAPAPQPAEAPKPAPAPAAPAAPAAPPSEAAPTPPAAEPAPEAAPPAAEAPATAVEPTEVPAASASPSPEAPRGGLGFGQWPEPGEDAAELKAQGEKRPEQLDRDRVLAEDWWSHTRPTLELHGYFRVRAELFHNFALGRIDPPNEAMWPRPSDDAYTDINGREWGPTVCTPEEAGTGSSNNPANADQRCSNNTQAGANMRFRVEPELVISDNLRVRTQIDFFDNLVLGSTPQDYRNSPGNGAYTVDQRDGYTPIGGASTTQEPSASAVNSLKDTVTVKRAWAEYTTPVGQLRFGRMPDNWGLGMVYNAGDDPDGDYQTTVDRIAFFTAIPSLSLNIGGAWDFGNETPDSESFAYPGQQPYDLGQQDDLSQYNVMLFRRVDPELERLQLAKGELVVNGGLYLRYQNQRIANDTPSVCTSGGAALDCEAGQASDGYARRGLSIWTPDVWVEVKYEKFKFEAEAATHQGDIQSLSITPDTSDYQNSDGEDGYRVNQWGIATKLRQLLVEDKLELGFDFGWASGDGDVNGLVPGNDGVQPQIGDNSIDTFRFNPAYRVDLILNRNILTRVQGSYYFKPSVRYDFIRKATGLRLGGLAEAIWTRASNFMQTPGHERDLGIELDATIYFQSKDGSLNDDPQKMGGFYSALQYGVLFPMAGLGYQADQTPAGGGTVPDLATAQVLRLFLGVIY